MEGVGRGEVGVGGGMYMKIIHNHYSTTNQFVRTCGCMLACLSERAVSIPAT